MGRWQHSNQLEAALGLSLQLPISEVILAIVWMQAALPGEGDPITSVNASLDGTVLAVQRGTAFIQFIHLTSNKMFVQVLPVCAGPAFRESFCFITIFTVHLLVLHQLASCLMIPWTNTHV